MPLYGSGAVSTAPAPTTPNSLSVYSCGWPAVMFSICARPLELDREALVKRRETRAGECCPAGVLTPLVAQ